MKRPHNPWQERFEYTESHPAPGVAAGPVAATATITCATNANMADSDYITIGDGMNPAVLYEYDKSANGVTGGRAAWAAGAGTAATVAATLKTAIEANQPAITVTDNLDGTLTLTHKWPGAGGNVTITENVTHASFTVAGFTGGAAADTTGATTSVKVKTAKRKMRVESIEYINPTGIAGHAANHWTLELRKGSTVIGSWTTDSDVLTQGTIAANTPVAFTLSTTDADLVVDVEDVISFVMTKAASAANLPPGRFTVRGHYVS